MPGSLGQFIVQNAQNALAATRGNAPRIAGPASPASAEAAIVGESHWDKWENRSRFELYSLVVDPAAVDSIAANAPFTEGGDPSLQLLLAADGAGLRLAEF